MVDYSTVLIAAISASAGLAGSVIAGHFNLKTLSNAHRKDDEVSIRIKVEELYAELDHIQELSNVSAVRALTAINANASPQEKFDAINLGKVRSIVGLYFPTCQAAIDAFDKQDIVDVEALRANFTNDPLTAVFSYMLVQCAGRSKMCLEMRDLLGKEAEVIGLSVRGGLGARPSA